MPQPSADSPPNRRSWRSAGISAPRRTASPAALPPPTPRSGASAPDARGLTRRRLGFRRHDRFRLRGRRGHEGLRRHPPRLTLRATRLRRRLDVRRRRPRRPSRATAAGHGRPRRSTPSAGCSTGPPSDTISSDASSWVGTVPSSSSTRTSASTACPFDWASASRRTASASSASASSDSASPSAASSRASGAGQLDDHVRHVVEPVGGRQVDDLEVGGKLAQQLQALPRAVVVERHERVVQDQGRPPVPRHEPDEPEPRGKEDLVGGALAELRRGDPVALLRRVHRDVERLVVDPDAAIPPARDPRDVADHALLEVARRRPHRGHLGMLDRGQGGLVDPRPPLEGAQLLAPGLEALDLAGELLGVDRVRLDARPCVRFVVARGAPG